MSENQILWCSETTWPAGVEAVAWCYKALSLAAIDPYGVVDQLDAAGVPWRMMDPDSVDVLIYAPAGDAAADMLLDDAGLFRPFSLMGG